MIESNIVQDLDVFDQTDKNADDGIKNLVPQETNCTVEHQITDGHKMSTNQYDTSSCNDPARSCPGYLAELADKFQLSIEVNTANELKTFLASQSVTDVLPQLVSVLEKAMDSGNQELITSINSYIKDKSPEIASNFVSMHRETFTKLKKANVWFGSECRCNKAEEIEYQNKLCNK